MEPYRTDRPKVYADMPNSLTALLGRLADAGIPLTHTLYEYAMNPDAPVSETAQNLTDEFVPFKYQIRSGEATPSSLTKEAILMFSPKKGGRRAVRVKKNGEPYAKDVSKWVDSKLEQYDRIMAERPDYKLDKLTYEVESLKEMLPSIQKWTPTDVPRVTQRIMDLENEINSVTLEQLNPSYKEYGKIDAMSDARGKPINSKYIYNKLVDEFGEDKGSKLYYKEYLDRAREPAGRKLLHDVYDLDIPHNVIETIHGGSMPFDESIWYD